MSSAQEELRILKVDTRGRVRMPPEKQERILDEFERSGMSGIAFAELIGVKYPTFASWRRRRDRSRPRRPRTGRSREGPVRFVEAQPAESSTALEVDLPGSARLRIVDRSQIPLVIELLRGLVSC
jgi:transposase-like protein